MIKRVHNVTVVTLGGRCSEIFLSKSDFWTDRDDNDEQELRLGDEKDRVNHGVEVVLSKLRVRVAPWTDSSVVGDGG